MPPKRAQDRTQDIPNRQVMIEDSDSDADPTWTHHILLVDLGSGTWIAADPDHDVESADLRKSIVVAPKRTAPFPERVKDSMLIFSDLKEGELSKLEADAYDLAGALGHTSAAKSTTALAGRRLADPAFASFNAIISAAEVLATDHAVVKGSPCTLR